MCVYGFALDASDLQPPKLLQYRGKPLRPVFLQRLGLLGGGHLTLFSVKVFFSVAWPAYFLFFGPVCLSSVSDPCSYPSCLCLPLRTSFFLVPLAFKVDVFTSPSPFS